MLLGAIGRRAIEARHLGRIVAQRVDAAREEALLAIHVAPVDAAVVDKGIELGGAELGPLLLDFGDDALPRDAEVPPRAQDAGALSPQARRELGTRPGVELSLNEAQRVIEGARGDQPGHIRGKTVVQVLEVLVRRLVVARSRHGALLSDNTKKGQVISYLAPLFKWSG